jgi:glycine/D-amino acid oxidase-like deaminating enzyme
MLSLPDTEESLWRGSSPGVVYPVLSEDIIVDAVIVGGGITGMTAAYLLKRSGMKVAVLEKRTIGAGTTGRTTGKITSQHNLIYSRLQKTHGKKATQIYGRANQAALEFISGIVSKERIDCDWRREDNYVYTRDISQTSEFRQESQVASAIGLPAKFVTDTPLPFKVAAAVRFDHQATFNSQKYLSALARNINNSGNHIYENSRVTRIHDGHKPFVKANGKTVKASHIIMATNVPTMPLAARGGYCLLEYPTESYIVAGELPKKFAGMYISPDSGEYSILPVKHLNKWLLLIGGEGHVSGLRVSKLKHYRRLADYAEERFGIGRITHRWSDRDYIAYDDIPLVGKLYSWSQNLYVATAFKKWGLSNGTAAALLLHDQIVGKENSWAWLFQTRLAPMASIPGVAWKYINRS